MADLIRAIPIPHEIDFMATSSYGSAARSSGVVRILKDLNKSIEGRNVVVVEDIIDSGHTLHYLLRMLQERGPASLRIVALLDKPERREVDIHVDWVGFSIPNDFVVGYGLDYNEIYRNLPYIGVLKPSIYSQP
jgi:hypoxanthine phosphoribosyltransferase